MGTATATKNTNGRVAIATNVKLVTFLIVQAPLKTSGTTTTVSQSQGLARRVITAARRTISFVLSWTSLASVFLVFLKKQ